MGLLGAIRSHPLVFLFGLAAISLLGLFLLVPPITQPQDYHRFADQKTLLGIPNFWNVVSNLPFILVGAAGLRYFQRDMSAGVFFLGVFLTGFSSSYYHWNPTDAGLFWDRLPMAIAFMAILSNVVEERIDDEVGRARVSDAPADRVLRSQSRPWFETRSFGPLLTMRPRCFAALHMPPSS